MGRLRYALRNHKDLILASACLLTFIIVPLVWTQIELDAVTDSFQTASSGETVSRAMFDSLTVRLDKQKEQRSGWAYAALVGIVAISVVKKVFAIPWVRWTYVLLGAAGTLLLQCIRAGDFYERRLAYLIIQPSLRDSDLNGISNLLWIQRTFLNAALAVLLIFVSAFLVAVVSGRTTFTNTEEG